MYVYQADTYCDSCGARLCADITSGGGAPVDPEDEYSFDSDDFPKWAGEVATDSPDHCAGDIDCLEPLDLFDYGLTTSSPLYGAESTHIGALLSDGLTAAGAAYTLELLAESNPTPYQSALHAYWREAFADELSLGAVVSIDHKAYAFFRGQGMPASSALNLTRAESLLERAQDLGVASVEWVDDDESYDPGDFVTEEEAREKFDSNEWTGPFGCVVRVFDSVEYGRDRAGDNLQSLWGIVVGPRGTADPYCRVIVAELACELEDDLRQVIGDALDALNFASEEVHCA